MLRGIGLFCERSLVGGRQSRICFRHALIIAIGSIAWPVVAASKPSPVAALDFIREVVANDPLHPGNELALP